MLKNKLKNTTTYCAFKRVQFKSLKSAYNCQYYKINLLLIILLEGSNHHVSYTHMTLQTIYYV